MVFRRFPISWSNFLQCTSRRTDEQLVKVAFFQEELMHLSFPQTPFVFLNLKIWIFLIFKAVLTSQTRPSCSQKHLSCQTWGHPQYINKFTKIQIFELRKIKGWYVWGNDKCISTLWKKPTFIYLCSYCETRHLFCLFLDKSNSLAFFTEDRTVANSFTLLVVRSNFYFQNSFTLLVVKNNTLKLTVKVAK